MNIEDSPVQEEVQVPTVDRQFFRQLFIITLLINLFTLLFFLYTYYEGTLLFRPVGSITQEEALAWTKEDFLTTLLFWGIESLLFILGVPLAVCFLLSRHIGNKKQKDEISKASSWADKVLWIIAAPFILCFVRMTFLDLVFLAVVLIVCAIIVLRSRKRPLIKREWCALAYLEILLIYFSFSMLSGYLQTRAAITAYEQAIARSAPIINALDRFHTSQSDYPENLEELVPDYMTDLPDTGMAAYPAFGYSRDTEVSEHYILVIYMRDRTGLGCITLWYWPEEDYHNGEKPLEYREQERYQMKNWLLTKASGS